MILTRLLVRSATNSHARFAFNTLADLPPVVAHELAPQILATCGSGSRIAYLTMLRVVWRFATFWRYRNRFFNAAGDCIVEVQ